MNLKIRKGKIDDISQIEKLYDQLIDSLQQNTNYPGWQKGVYPTREDAIKGVKDDCLYVALNGDIVVGSIILRHEPEEAYYHVQWKKDLTYDKVFVIYTFAIHPDYSHQGIATKLLEYAETLAYQQNIESLRLDVVSTNLPAIHLYKKCQFEYIDTVDLGLSEYGLDWFELYEKVLEMGDY